MHTDFWQTVVDALFYLQLGWVFAGFGLMAYLSFKVFPAEDAARKDESSGVSGGSRSRFSPS